MAGFGIASLWWSTSVSVLSLDLQHANKDKQDLQDGLNRTKDELSRAKADYAQYVTAQPHAELTSKDANEVRVTVTENQTESLFDGALTISLVGTGYEGDPLHYTTTANVGSPGSDEVLKIEGKDVGYRVKYRDRYEMASPPPTRFRPRSL